MVGGIGTSSERSCLEDQQVFALGANQPSVTQQQISRPLVSGKEVSDKVTRKKNEVSRKGSRLEVSFEAPSPALNANTTNSKATKTKSTKISGPKTKSAHTNSKKDMINEATQLQSQSSTVRVTRSRAKLKAMTPVEPPANRSEPKISFDGSEMKKSESKKLSRRICELMAATQNSLQGKRLNLSNFPFSVSTF